MLATREMMTELEDEIWDDIFKFNFFLASSFPADRTIDLVRSCVSR
jgi:hypothetical protein